MTDYVVIGDVVGRDNLVGGVNADVGAIIAAKLAAKRAEAEREAAEDNAPVGRSGGVTLGPGSNVTVGGKVYQGDWKPG